MKTSLLSTPLRKRRSDFERSRRALVSATRRLIAERGPDAVTVSDVAYAAGVNRTTAYQHFRSREELVGAALAQIGDELSEMLCRAMPLDRRIDLMVEHLSAHPEIARLWMSQMLADRSPKRREGYQRYMEAMRKFAASEMAREGIDPEMLGELLLTATLAFSLRVHRKELFSEGPERARERFVRELKRLLLFGAVKPERAPEMVEALGPVGEHLKTASASAEVLSPRGDDAAVVAHPGRVTKARAAGSGSGAPRKTRK